jgi:hypothetical protein
MHCCKPDAVNQALEEFRAYLETLTCIQIDPRLRGQIRNRTSSRTPSWMP